MARNGRELDEVCPPRHLCAHLDRLRHRRAGSHHRPERPASYADRDLCHSTSYTGGGSDAEPGTNVATGRPANCDSSANRVADCVGGTSARVSRPTYALL